MNLKKIFDSEKIVDMANLLQDDTGIPGRVRISSKYAGHKIPRLKYEVQNEEISVSITDNPKVLSPKIYNGDIPSKFNGIVKWIGLNKNLLITYWNDPNYPTRQLINNLIKVE